MIHRPARAHPNDNSTAPSPGTDTGKPRGRRQHRCACRVRLPASLAGPDESARPADDFATFYAATFATLCGQLFIHTGDLAEAQDVLQEAFTRAYTRWGTVRAYDDPVAWIRKVAWNLATSRWRRLRRVAQLGYADRSAPLPGPNGDRVDLQKALARLPVRQRQAVVLHYLADLSVGQIAALTGAPEGTVKSWLHRARTSLIGQYAKAGDVDA